MPSFILYFFPVVSIQLFLKMIISRNLEHRERVVDCFNKDFYLSLFFHSAVFWVSIFVLFFSLSPFCGFFFFLSNFFLFHHVARGILVPGPRIKPSPSALEAWSFNHGTAREVPVAFLKSIFFWKISSTRKSMSRIEREWCSDALLPTRPAASALHLSVAGHVQLRLSHASPPYLTPPHWRLIWSLCSRILLFYPCIF